MSCNTSNIVSFGAPGKNGTSAYVYVAYADDVVLGTPDVVTNFVYGTPESTSKWIAFKKTSTEITNPVESDFQGLWINPAIIPPLTDTNLYNTNGTLTGNRNVSGDGYTLTFQDILNLVLASSGTLRIVNVDSPTTFIQLTSDTVQINGETFLHYGDNHNVTANISFNIAAGTSGLIGTSSGGNVARIGFGSGEIRIDASGQLNVYSGGVYKYTLPLTTPTVGQVLTAIDNLGTTDWV